MKSAPPSVLAAVRYQYEQKREQVSDAADRVDALVRKLQSAEADLQGVEQEAQELLSFLRENGYQEDVVPVNGMPGISSAPMVVGADGGLKPYETHLSGTAIRRGVVSVAKAVAEENEFFTVDDILAKLEERGYKLKVQTPRVRVSQVLSSEDFFEYVDEKRAWKKATPS